MATKVKRTKIESRRPPREIQEKTKERRAWLAEQMALLSSISNLEAKIVGTGSYQEISIYKLTEVEGRVQLRGHCQFCGHEQAVKSDVLVLHGFTRPGDGQTWGRCPGVGKKPLNVDKSVTEFWLARALEGLEEQKTALGFAEQEYEMASQVWLSQSDDEKRAAEQAKPKRPWASWNTPTYEQRQQHEAALDAHKAAFPVYAAYLRAQIKVGNTKNAIAGLRNDVSHFKMLLEFGFFGRPLREEVV